MSGDPLKKLLESMPRERAREGFSSRVLAELDRRADPPPARRWLVPAAVAVGLVLMLGVGGTIYLSREQDRRAELAAQLEQLRQDHQQLTEELQDLRQKLQTKQVIYLGGDHRADYILDLRRLVRSPGPGTSDPMPQPFIHGPDDLPIGGAGGGSERDLIRGESL